MPNSPSPAWATSPVAGILLKLLATFLFAMMVAIVKHTSAFAPTGEIMFSRSFFALVPLFIIYAFSGNLRDVFVVSRPWRHVTRSLVGVCAMFCGFTALSILPLPEATAISFATPLMIVIFAAIFLKETVRMYRWTAVFVGLVGVFIILWPRLSTSSADIEIVGVSFAVLSTAFAAMAAIMVRRLTATETNASIIFYFTVATSLFSLLSLYWGWSWPTWQQLGWLILVGFLGGLGQIAMTQAFRLAEASLLAPLDYTNMVWAILLGIFLFDEFPSAPVMTGGTVVIVAGLFILYRENKLRISIVSDRRFRTR